MSKTNVGPCNCPKCAAQRARAAARDAVTAEHAADVIRKAIADDVAARAPRKTKEEWERHFGVPPDGYDPNRRRPAYVSPNPALAGIDGYAMALAKRKEQR